MPIKNQVTTNITEFEYIFESSDGETLNYKMRYTDDGNGPIITLLSLNDAVVDSTFPAELFTSVAELIVNGPESVETKPQFESNRKPQKKSNSIFTAPKINYKQKPIEGNSKDDEDEHAEKAVEAAPITEEVRNKILADRMNARAKANSFSGSKAVKKL